MVRLRITSINILPQAGMDVNHSKLGNKILERSWSERLSE